MRVARRLLTCVRMLVKGSAAASLPQFGRYHTVALLGVGGMAEVYRAICLDARGQPFEVVLKRIRPELEREPAFMRMFEREATTSLRLIHPNLVRVLDHGPTENGYVQVMEYIDGCTLVHLIRARRRPVPWPQAALIAREIARGLSYMHATEDEQGRPRTIVHRDISPDNVMVSTDGRVKILDFGIAKALEARNDVSLTGTLKGKLGYMAPEQLEALAIDERVDQFALGVVLHELLTGRRLYAREAKLGSLRRERRAAVRRPSEVIEEIPAELDDVVTRMLAPDPMARFPTTAHVARTLDVVLGGIEVGAAELAALVSDAGPARHPMAGDDEEQRTELTPPSAFWSSAG